MWWCKKNPKPVAGPDFSEITSRAKAEELFRKGILEKLYLMPLEFGGHEIPENVTYVPIGFAAAKANIDLNIIAGLVKDGTVSNYSAKPKYRGRSFVPESIEITATDPGTFSASINIWGDAINGT